MKRFIKQLFCNHTSMRCLTNYDSYYLDKITGYTGKPEKYAVWQCERCGKKIVKPIKEAMSTFNWVNITIKENN